MSSLVAQLAQNASLNAAFLVDRTKRKPTVSYLFAGRDADQHDLEAIHALGLNALLHLASIDSSLVNYEETLLSEQAKETDRTLLTKEQNGELDKTLTTFLLRLSPHLLEAPTGRILEWLVRRFRIHEFNVEAVLAAFLPYHESPHFTKMISILQIKENSKWSFLLPYKSAAQKLPRVSLVTEMLKNPDIARFVALLLPNSMKKGLGHHVLIAFNAATMNEFITRSDSLDEGALAYILPAFLDPLQQKAKNTSADAVLGSYILLSALSRKCQLTPAALKVTLTSMAICSHLIQEHQFLNALVAVCEHQEEAGKFPDPTSAAILRISDIHSKLPQVLKWSGSEKVVRPMLKNLVDRLTEDISVSTLEGIVAEPSAESTVVKLLTELLTKIAVDAQTEGSVVLASRRLLSIIQQRYPATCEQVSQELCESDESLRSGIEQLTISMSLKQQGTGEFFENGGEDMVLGTSNADSKVRALAVKTLLQTIAGKDISAIEDIASIQGSLLARLQDSDTQVIQELYQDAPSLTSLVLYAPASYVSALELAVSSPTAKPKRNILRLHLSFLVEHFWPRADTPTKEAVAHKIIFPLLLASKSRQKAVEFVWGVVNKHLLTSCDAKTQIWLGKLSPSRLELPEKGDATEVMVGLNTEIAESIAQNIASSDDLEEQANVLIAKLNDGNVYSKHLAYLITLALLGRLTDLPRLQLARKVMDTLSLEALSGVDDLPEDAEASEGLPFGKLIVTKPHSLSTLRWLEIAIFEKLAQLPKPDDCAANWFIERKGSEKEGSLYVYIAREVYRVTNASTTLPSLTSVLLQKLFLNLKEEALVFLAGLWSTSSLQKSPEVAFVALRHAAAFLEAHVSEKDGVDFQTILPSLLIALQNTNSAACDAALECLSRIAVLSGSKFTSVYRFDVIYGHVEGGLQYLDQADLKHYLTSLLERRDHLLNDPSYLKVFHAEHLNRSSEDTKKDTEYKHRVSCFILSHINAFPSLIGQVALLDSVSIVAEKARVIILRQIIDDVANATSPADLSSQPQQQLTLHLFSSFDTASAGYLNSRDDVWQTFLRVLRAYMQPNIPSSLQKALQQRLESGLFSTLNAQKKTILCELLLEIGAADPTNSCPRNTLAHILMDVTLMVHLLQLASPEQNPSVPKRVKTSLPTESTSSRLMFLVEVLGTRPLPGSLDLITCLLNTLNQVLQSFPPTYPNISYVEQLIMSAIESSASKITVVPNISPSVIRLEILVELIRVSGNPQTFQQALLLMANLARLAPESVLFNVMPVFTFMGSNVFHRDDTYSFKVVQQTIDGIVPVMAASLKRSYSTPLDLYIGSREFLRLFTDAANHIPRHRRNNFFVHLVGVLGVKDFLPPLCMLLVEKLSNKVTRQQPEDIQTSLALPIAIFQQAPFGVQKYAAGQIIEEVQRLIKRGLEPTSSVVSFLEATLEGDHSISSSTLLRRRCQALLLFLGHALKGHSKHSVSDQDDFPISAVMADLIKLATLPSATGSDLKLENISDVAQTAMGRLLKTMAVSDFIQSTEAMLCSGDVKVQGGALELLAARLPDVSHKARQEATSSVIKILELTKGILQTHKTGAIVSSAFRALEAISKSICPGEEGSLTESLPFIIAALRDQECVGSALSALPSISVKLGPRVIPFFRQLVSQIVTILRGSDSSLFEAACATLTGLLSTIPTFCGSGEVSQIVYLYMDNISMPNLSSSLTKLMKSTTKKVPSKVILPTLLDMWSAFRSSKNMARFSAFFEVLARALQHAERASVMEHLRPAFSLFLEAFDIVGIDEKAKSRAISAFRELVVKLNETAFKPLFRRIYDWAFANEGATDSRRTIFNHIYSDLLDFFKGLMVPYTSFLLQPYNEILKGCAASSSDDYALWSSVIQTLTRTLNYDDGGFWRTDKLRDLSTPLTSQIEVCVRVNVVESKSLLQECFAAFVENAGDDTLLKAFNLNILMHTRSEDSRIRIYALACAESLWRSHGNKLLGFVAETATFIAECGDDENDVVVKESFRLKDAVESMAGKIDEL